MQNKQNIQDIYPLSTMQESMLFHSLLSPNSTAYFEQTSFTIQGKLNLEIFRDSVAWLVERHNILRTVFVHKNLTRPFQVVLKKVEPVIREYDIRGFSPENQEAYFEDLKQGDFKESFDLSKDVLMRIILVRTSETEYHVIWSHHHILMDGWCMGIIIAEFLEIYKAKLNGNVPKLSAVVPYVHYIKWLEKQDKETAKQYWKEYLSGINEPSSLARNQSKNNALPIKKVVFFDFGEDFLPKLDSIARENQITVNAIFQTAWGILLNKYNHTTESVFGSVVSGRPAEIPDVGGILGLFINTIPAKVLLKEGSTFLDLAKDMQSNNTSSLGKEYLTLADIQNQSSLKNNLFDHILVYENYPSTSDIEEMDPNVYGFKIKDIATYEQTNYNLNVIILPEGNHLSIKYDFNETVYPESVIRAIHQHLVTIFEQVMQRTGIMVSDITLLSSEQMDRVILANSDAPKPTFNGTVVERFQSIAGQYPDAVAVEYNSTVLTYKELDEKSNTLAHRLQTDYLVQQGDIVAILADRSEQTLITLLGILKSGASYIPVDKSNPAERVKYMLEDSKAKVLITDSQEVFDVPVLNMELVRNLQGNPLAINLSREEDRAYIIYTSGSTGQPKGCQISHKNLWSYLSWSNEYYFQNCEALGNTGLYTSLSFDLTVTSIFLPLIRGKKVKVYPQALETEEILKDVFSDSNEIDFLKITPAHASLLPHLGIGTSNVQGIVVGGDELKQDQLENMLSISKSIVVFNEYGPTETTVGCSVKKLTSVKERITVGKATGNAQIYLLDKDLNLLPDGALGEICVAGEGVGLGYYNKPELTNEKFVFQTRIGKKIYRTGDLGMYDSKGEIVYFGRIDSQAKVRGYRVETGEVEHYLLQMEGMQQAFVTVQNDLLCAYIVEVQNPASEKEKINTWLQKFIPAYMVPDVYIRLEQIPLTPNGKVDRAALPDPKSVSVTGYRAPQTENEKKLATIWQTILGVEKVGLDDHFFDLGGHSLKTTILSSMILKAFEKEIRLKQIFECPVFSEQVKLIESGETGKDIRINPSPEKEYYRLSNTQERLFLLHQIDPESVAYNIPAILRVKGKLDVEKFRNTFVKMIERHEVLRTAFEMVNGNTVQIIRDRVDFKVDIIDLSGEATLDKIEHYIQPFNLSNPPLIRVVLGSISEDDHLLLIDMHHIISDGISVKVFIEEFTRLYNNIPTEPLAIQYKDFAEWQSQRSGAEVMQDQKTYWIKEFADLPEPLELPYKGKRPATWNFDGDAVLTDIDQELYAQIEALARKNDASVYMVLLAAYNLLLHKYSGQKDIVIGTPVSGRTHPDIQQMLGAFINTLAIRLWVNDDFTGQQYLRNIRDKAINAFDHQDYPFEALVEELSVPRDLSRNSLFDVLFNYQTKESSVLPVLDGAELIPMDQSSITSKFDIALEASQHAFGISINFQYATALFDRPFIKKFAEHFVTILKALVTQPEEKIAGYEVLTTEERNRLLVDFNSSYAPVDRSKSLVEVFEEQVVAYPNQPAIVYEGKQLSYTELNQKANQIAEHLRAKGVNTNDLVALLVNRSLDTIIGIIGILKSGAAYLPIDPSFPENRIAHIIYDSGVKAVIMHSAFNELVENKSLILNMEQILASDPETKNPGIKNQPNDLAYCIYTSGSTGQPKGVLIEHGNVLNLIAGLNKDIYSRYTGAPKHLNVALIASYIFDASVQQIFATLLQGHTLHIISQDTKENGQKLIDYYRQHSIHISDGTPSFLQVLTDENVAIPEDLNLKHFIIGGEGLPSATVKQLWRKFKEDKVPLVTNVYGPTECCVDATSYEIAKEDLEQYPILPIGKPMLNHKVYVLDQHQNLVPVGVRGELCIANDGVGRGYLNNRELTQAKFADNPVTGEGKMYRTGDYARWTNEGLLEFLGRMDQQVKIRGYRIELGDIESQFRNLEGVENAVVVDLKDSDGNKILCAYYIANKEFSIADLRSTLSMNLPDYMIPTFFVKIDYIPLTTNGKLDRKKLPQPEIKSGDKTAFTAPVTELEIKLERLWSRVLGIEKLSTTDNFFELGGHSLKATQLVALIHKELSIQISLRDFFSNPTILKLVNLVGEANLSKSEAIARVEERDSYPLSAAQRRLFVLSEMNSGITYNMPGAVRMVGNPDVERIKNAFHQLVERHESFRTSFAYLNGEPVQRIHKQVDFNVEIRKVENESEARNVVAAFVQPFDLNKAPLLRVALVQMKSDEFVLIFDMHHIISDGASMKILVNEFGKLYWGIALEPLSIRYVDFADWQNKLFQTTSIETQKLYWTKQLSGELPVLNLPTDRKRPETPDFVGDRVKFSITGKAFDGLKSIAKSHNATMFMTVLSVYKLLLSKLSNQEDLIVGTPIAGRTHADLQSVMGMFVNTLAIRSFPEHTKTFSDFLGEVKRCTEAAYDHQDYPFDQLVSHLDLPRDTSRNPVFDTMLVYEAVEEQAVAEESGVKFIPYDHETVVAKFDLAFSVMEKRNGLECMFDFATALFDSETITKFSGWFELVVGQVVENESIPLGKVSLLSDQDLQILRKFNQNKEEYKKGETLVSLFTTSVVANRTKTAIIHRENQISYNELEEQSNRMADFLSSKGLNQGEIVAILLPKGIQAIATMLGIMKAGGAYLPIDTEHPKDRIEYYLTDSGSKFLITERQRTSEFEYILPVFTTNESANAAPAYTSETGEQNNAYVIYTSGSTGKPKGVAIRHESIVNTVFAQIQVFELKESQNYLQFASLAFDASVAEIFEAMALGSTLVIADKETIKDPAVFTEYCNTNKVAIAQLTPAYIALLDEKAFSSLEVVISAGDVIQPIDASRFSKKLNFYNAYGPTETAICATAGKVESGLSSSVSIGKSIPNCQVYMVDALGVLVPVGVEGELCIAGIGVADGYLNRPELTREKFIDNPLDPGHKMYRSGDLARFRTNGTIEYLGRIDQQVKIRGYRIETGEIEQQLLEIKGIKEAVVLDRTDLSGDKYLCAYLVATGENDPDKIKSKLKSILPEYMVPAFIIQVERIPLTINGKIDKRALPAPEMEQVTKVVFENSRNEQEAAIVNVWQKVLGFEKISIHASFFDLGGDSIKAIQVAARLKSLGYKADIQTIFKYPVVQDLAKHLIREVNQIEQGEVVGTAPWTPIQRSFLQTYLWNKNHFNQSLMFCSPSGFDVVKLENAFARIIEHHDALRTVVKTGQQEVLPVASVPFSLEKFDFSTIENPGLLIDEEVNRLQRSFDLNKAPLIRAAWFKTQSGDHLAIIIHHFVVDGVSWRILLEDLNTLYANPAAELPMKSNSFLDWATALQNYAHSTSFLQSNKHWFGENYRNIPVIFAQNNPASNGVKNNAKVIFTETETTNLLLHANKAYTTQITDLLMASLGSALSTLSKQEKILITFEGHGREEILPALDISRTVGWFTSVYPVLLGFSNQEEEKIIINTKESIRKIPQNGIGYGILKELTRDDQKEGFNTDLTPQVLMNYLGQFDDTAKSDFFKSSAYSSGDNNDQQTQQYPLEINGLVVEGKLSFDFDGDDRYISSEQITTIAAAFKTNLNRLVDHCLRQEIKVKTPSDFGLNSVTYDQLHKLQQSYPYEIEKIYPLSPMQQGMLFINMIQGEQDAYFEQAEIGITGKLELKKVESAFNKLIARHEIIRSNVVFEDLDRPYTVVAKEKFSTVYFEDLSDKNPQEQEQAIVDYKARMKRVGIDLKSDPLMSVSVFQTGPEDYKIIWSHHHIIMDGWCLGIVFSEFLQYYNAQDEHFQLAPTNAYEEYIRWIEAKHKDEAIDYWKTVVSDYDEKIRIPGLKKSSSAEPASFRYEELTLTDEEYLQLETFTRANQITVFNLIQALWGVLLQKYNNTSSAVFGAVVSGRPPEIEGVEQMVGLFINTIPVNVSNAGTFLETVIQLQKQFSTSDQYNYLPLNEIQNLSELKGELIDHFVVYESYPMDENSIQQSKESAALKVTGLEAREITNYDFSLKILPQNNLTIWFDYNEVVYDSVAIQKLAQAFRSVLNQILENPTISIDQISITSEAEKDQIINQFNRTQHTFDDTKTLHELFEERVAENPSAIALVFEEHSMTYGELNEKSNQIAHQIRACGVVPYDLVGIKTDRSMEMVIGMLAILKSGAAYMPMDPEIPAERMKFLLKDSRAKVLLTDHMFHLEEAITVLNLKSNEVFTGDKTNPEKIGDNTNLAYVIYTSGSTGQPKGVMLEHRGVVNRIEWMKNEFGFNSEEILLQKTAYTFDVSVGEFFMTLCYGATLVLCKKEVTSDVSLLVDLIEKQGVTYIHFVPSMFKLFLMGVEGKQQQLVSLKNVYASGEALPPESVKQFHELFDIRLSNLYGPTEASVEVSYFKTSLADELIPIGKPIWNTELLIFDKAMNIAPIGVPGELHIGGVQLARGYMNNPELTAEKFIPHPFKSGERLYKTGDLARCLPDGNIEYLGRIDFQVKIRGFRIELGDIESQLMKMKDLNEVAVVDRVNANGDKFLCAYIVSKTTLDLGAIKAHLAANLPDYMVPSFFVKMDALPLNSSGKLNRKALPEPDGSSVDRADYVAPSTGIQVALVHVLQEVLGIESIGIKDNFFALGGDSIKAIMVASKLQKYNYKLDMKDLFAHPSVEALEPYIAKLKFVAEQGPVFGEFPLAPMQRYFFESKLEFGHHYNQAIMLFSEKKVEEQSWRQALDKLVQQHDVLRSTFDPVNKKQIISREQNGPFYLIESFDDLHGAQISERAGEIQGKLNYEHGPVVASAVFHTQEGTHVLLALHHLVVDGVSWRIILEDLNTLMNNGQLPPKVQSFKSWTERLTEYAESAKLAKELSYWQQQESGYSVIWPEKGSNTYQKSVRKKFTLSKEHTRQLQQDVNSAYHTEVNDILLSALSQSLPMISGVQRNIVYMEGHGRENIFENQDITRTVGWFTSLYPLVLETANSSELPRVIKSTKESVRKIPDKGIGYGILRYLNQEVATGGELCSIPEITFNYLGQFDVDDKEGFRISNLSGGNTVHLKNTKDSVLDVAGMIRKEELTMDFGFNPEMIREELMDQFLESYKTNLEAIIEHCTSREETEHTVSDFESEDLSEDELDDILDMLDDL